MALRIDRDRFLFLVSALGAVACTEHDRSSIVGTLVAAEPEPPKTTGVSQAPGMQTPAPTGSTFAAPTAVKTVAAPVHSSSKPAVVATPAHAEDTPAVVCGTQNDEGAVDCTSLKGGKLSGPSCEGMSGTCDLLAGGKIYRPRAAKAAAACMSRMGARACDIGVRNKCYNEGVHAACPEAQFASVCQTKMDECKAKGQPVTYTKEECMKAASALTGGDRTWAINAMGPSHEGACRLMYTVF